MASPALLAPAEWARLRTLLDGALARPTATRDAWLEALPEGDQRWRERLRTLLAADDQAQPLLNTQPRVEIADFAPPPGAAVPTAVGPYRPLRELGQGGMASVWLAERTDLLQSRQVALKLPHRSWRRSGLAKRMQRERESLVTLNHSHIACRRA
jgi:eukaryotic-like serine/threonine-protein kinase